VDSRHRTSVVPPGNWAAVWSHCRPSNPENDPSLVHWSGPACRVSGTRCQVAPPSEDASTAPKSASSVSYHRSKDRRAPAAGTVTGTVRVAVVLSATPENQSVLPSAGCTGRASARSRATARRDGLLLPQLRLGCTRLVSRMTNEWDSGSMTIDVPVYPVW